MLREAYIFMKRTIYYETIRNGGGKLPFPVIDNHGHLAAEKYIRLPLEEEVKEVVEVLDFAFIDKAVVFPFASDYRRGNDQIIRGVSLSGGRLIGYAQMNLDSAGLMLGELRRCFSHGLKGLKLHSAFGSDFNNPAWKDVWDFCAQNSWPVIIHGMIPSLAVENPGTVFIHAHGIEKIFQPETVEIMKRCDNHYWDTSATFTFMGAVEKAVSCFGSEKLLFGSDLPLNNPAVRMGSVLAAGITGQDIKNILGGNISRLLGPGA